MVLREESQINSSLNCTPGSWTPGTAPNQISHKVMPMLVCSQEDMPSRDKLFFFFLISKLQLIKGFPSFILLEIFAAIKSLQSRKKILWLHPLTPQTLQPAASSSCFLWCPAAEHRDPFGQALNEYYFSVQTQKESQIVHLSFPKRLICVCRWQQSLSGFWFSILALLTEQTKQFVSM